MDICKNMLSFSKSEFIVEYSLLSHFIGKVYSIIITACSDLEQWEQIKKVSQYGICKETLVWEFIDLEIIKRESILCIFNSERTFEGLLLNYVSEKNHACFEGKVSEVKYHKYDSKIVDIYLPFLHLLSKDSATQVWRKRRMRSGSSCSISSSSISSSSSGDKITRLTAFCSSSTSYRSTHIRFRSQRSTACTTTIKTQTISM
jgi:hypothetical protein